MPSTGSRSVAVALFIASFYPPATVPASGAFSIGALVASYMAVLRQDWQASHVTY